MASPRALAAPGRDRRPVLKKGSKVSIEGKLQTRSWEDNKGQKRYITEIVVSNMEMLDGNSGPAELDMGYGHGQNAAQSVARASTGGEDGLPF